MKKIICALLTCALCASALAGMSGCGCSQTNTQQPGYVVKPTEPDLTNDEFGFFMLGKKDLMITAYFGSSKNVVMPESYKDYKVSSVGHSLFNGKDIESVEMADSITEIQDYAFAGNKNLSDVKMSKGIKSIGLNAFFNCPKLESIELPATLQTVSPYAFAGSGLKSVVYPESKTLKTIADYTFFQCYNLKEVTLSKSLTSIADNAFNECDPDIVFNVPKGSYALKYVKKNKLNYKEY